MSALAKFGKPLPPPRLDDYYEGADLSSSSESEKKPLPRRYGLAPSQKSCAIVGIGHSQSPVLHCCRVPTLSCAILDP